MSSTMSKRAHEVNKRAHDMIAIVDDDCDLDVAVEAAILALVRAVMVARVESEKDARWWIAARFFKEAAAN